MFMNGGQKIAEVIRSYGVRHLFTLCGGHIGPIYVAAEKAGIRIWDVRDEATAIFAADATARLTGITGVAAVTAGPGVTNAITALKNAQMAQSPVLLLGGATATLLHNRGALQDIDQAAIVRSTVKFHTKAKKVRDLAPATALAMKVAQNGIPGPVFVECPVDTDAFFDGYTGVAIDINRDVVDGTNVHPHQKILRFSSQNGLNQFLNP